mmetsp:Transcript_41130/g.108664  ORF Transcript_41130/g.108664 Transcript_41130/m.108664 type:complete len:237 (-) Transcript_41130:74-784(-)
MRRSPRLGPTAPRSATPSSHSLSATTCSRRRSRRGTSPSFSLRRSSTSSTTCRAIRCRLTPPQSSTTAIGATTRTSSSGSQRQAARAPRTPKRGNTSTLTSTSGRRRCSTAPRVLLRAAAVAPTGMWARELASKTFERDRTKEASCCTGLECHSSARCCAATALLAVSHAPSATRTRAMAVHADDTWLRGESAARKCKSLGLCAQIVILGQSVRRLSNAHAGQSVRRHSNARWQLG